MLKCVVDVLVHHELDRQPARLLHPVGEEDVRLARLLAIPIRSEHELFPVVREHREAVELDVMSNLFDLFGGDIHHEEIEVAAFGVGHVRREDHPFAVGVKIRPEIGRAVVGQLGSGSV
jgi:hypothetical protein